MKTKEELNALKREVKALNEKLAELTDEELKEVVGGVGYNLPQKKDDERYVLSDFKVPENQTQYEIHIYGKDDLNK